MLEILLITVCIQGPGCNEATKAYYLNSTYLQDLSKNTQKIVDKNIDKQDQAIIGTTIGICFIHQGTVNLGKNFDVVIGNTNMLQWHWEY